MTYNLSSIMKTAHSLRKENNYSMSSALQTAWLRAKIEVLDESRFSLKMKDRWNADDERQNALVSAQISKLGYRIWEVKEADRIAKGLEYDIYGNLVANAA